VTCGQSNEYQKNAKIKIPDSNGLFYPCLFKPEFIKVCQEFKKQKPREDSGDILSLKSRI
jgi:hypothetical protein